MHAVEIIEKKRDGLVLTKEEINWFVEAYTRGDLPDYQAAAWLMAVFLKGMTREETVNLTLAMAHSGDLLDLSDLTDYAVDKHSSGGVGDKTTLVVLPLVAAFGVLVAKMSGRGLGLSGGTLDKLEAIAGYNVNLSSDEFYRLARENGIVLAGQSMQLAPADGKLYALRDVTGTVPSLPLIAGSIMSKKIAAGARGIVLDVKVGGGAFMKNLDDARSLAQQMVDIGKDAGRDVIAAISDMNQPLGHAVGNALEVVEAIDTLRGGGPDDFRQHCVQIAAHMLRLAGRGERWTDTAEVEALLLEKLNNGEAFEKFRAMVAAQGGDVAMIDDPTRLPQARFVEAVTCDTSGNVARVAALDVARAAFVLGAGREKKDDVIDLAVGVKVSVKVGDALEAGTPFAHIYANDADKVVEASALLKHALVLSDEPVDALPLFYSVIYSD